MRGGRVLSMRREPLMMNVLPNSPWIKRKLTRAESARINGAKSRGPVSAEGKSRSAQNGLRHGLTASRFVLLPNEDVQGYRALHRSVFRQLRPADATEASIANRVVRCIWLQRRVERIEQDSELLSRYGQRIYRYEASLRRQYCKALEDLAAHRQKRRSHLAAILFT